MLIAPRVTAFTNQLQPFLPEGCARYIAEFLIEHTVHFTVSKKRKSKFGDYRQPFNGKPHRISVNGDLNKYAFLVTTLHEMAHLITFNQYGNKVAPHGIEWKNDFITIAQPIIDKDILPTDITLALKNYLKNAKASSCSDDKLYRVLRRYDKNRGTTLEELEKGTIFKLNGKTFVKGKKLRTRYECEMLPSRKKYRVLGLADVKTIESKE